jgi:HK97 family phage major capsid protein
MSYAKQLREKKARLATQMRAIVDAAKKEDRGLNTEERTSWDKMCDEAEKLSASIEAVEKTDKLEAELAIVDDDKIVVLSPDRATGGKKIDDSPHAKAFGKFLRYGIDNLAPEEKQLMRNKFVPNGGGIQNAQTITTTGGGYLIPQGFSDKLEEALKWYGGILGVVGEFSTETGQPLPWPTVNDTSNLGSLISINTQVSETDFTLGQVTFNAYIFSSNSVLVPIALIEDSYFDLDTFIARNLGIRLGRVVNHYATVGTGSSQPYGIEPAVVASGNTSQGATGETTSLVYNDLVNTLHLVDPAYRNNPSSKWMFHDSTLKAIRKLVDGNNRPLWMPGLTAGFGQGFPETILDKPYAINNDMPVMAANAYSVLFGDLSKFMVRRVAGGTTVLRLVERYADYLQVGYIGFLRLDSQLLDAGTHPIAAFQNSAT